MSRRGRWLLLAGLGAFLLFSLGGAGAGLFAEYHWFDSLGFRDRFWKLELARWTAWIVLFLGSAAVVWWSLHSVHAGGGPVQVRRKLGDLEIAEALPERYVRWGMTAVALFTGLLVAGPFAGALARQALFAAAAPSWGQPDPVLGHDPRFYVFYLPLLRNLWSVVVATLTWTAIGVGAVLLLSGRIRATEKGIRLDAFARRRLVGLGAMVLVVLAGHFGLSLYETVAGGPVGYAQVHGEIPARRLLAGLAVVAAAALVWAERRDAWRPAIGTAAALALAWPLGLGLYPEAIQRLRVEPNELELERPYLEARIAATRRGFDLERIRRVRYGLTGEPPALEAARRYTAGLPLWDERPLKATYDQLQGLIAYHEFPDVDGDRYGSEDRREQVAVAVREFSPARLTPSARTWQNLHLRYTYGQGWVVTAVDRATEGGEPDYLVSGLPPEVAPSAPPGLEVEEPRVYFGELTAPYVVIPPDSFPDVGPPTGARMGGLGRRALFAWALGSKNLLLRDPGPSATRLVWRRQVVERVRRIVPFLLVDPNPVPVIHEGHVRWILELYAASSGFPLSEPAELRGTRVNYVRSVAKAVVDGVTGETRLYTMAPGEPLLTTYRTVLPGLFEPLEAMPPGLRKHLRYPPALFGTQARVLEAYHMTAAEQFYQRRDLWSVGREVYDRQAVPVDPYFLLMPFPGARNAAGGEAGGAAGAGATGSQEFLLTLPFTPRNRDNLSSFLLARNDGAHYGELWLFELSEGRQVFGPRQVEVQIDQDPIISQQLSLWQQLGSRAIRGHLLLVPIEGALLYVEPLFLVAEDREGAAPGLKRVIAATGDRVAMGLTLNDALERLLGDRPRMRPVADEEGALPAAGAGVAPGGEGIAGGAPGDDALDRLRRLLERADAALRAGDLETFGRLWEEIRGLGADTTAATAGGDPGRGG